MVPLTVGTIAGTAAIHSLCLGLISDHIVCARSIWCCCLSDLFCCCLSGLLLRVWPVVVLSAAA